MKFSKQIKKIALPYYQKTNTFFIRKNKDHKIIWQFCTPKSASTYLMVLIENIIERSKAVKNVKQHKLVGSYFVEKQQEPSTNRIFLKHFLSSRKFSFTGHSHTHFSDYLDVEILSNQHRIICQTRSLLDTIASFYDHVEKFHREGQNISPEASSMPMMKCRKEEWQEFSKKERYDILIQYYVPWHIDFLISWLVNNKNHSILLVQYKDLIGNTTEEITKILDYCELEYDPEIIPIAISNVATNSNGSIRKNKGISNRGQMELTDEQQSRVKEMINLRADYFHKISGRDLHSFI